MRQGIRRTRQAAKALAELCQIYWPPLYGYLRGRGLDREAAQDLTQGFFARLLERHDVRAADPGRGRFRAFLLTALKRYVINEHERASSMRRGGTLTPLSLDFEQAERSFAVDHRNDDTPERVFDRKWAAITLDRALQRLRDECIQSGKGKTADALMPYLTDTGNLPAYREIAAGSRTHRGRREGGGPPSAAALWRGPSPGDRRHRGQPGRRGRRDA